MKEQEQTTDHKSQADSPDPANTTEFATGRAAQTDGSESLNDNPWPTHAGRYQIGEEIARGGMGVVLRAQDPAFQRTIAIKVLLQQNSADADKRFQEEARIASQLQHPGIAPLYDVGNLDDGRPFFAMKLIEGRTLSDLLDDRENLVDDLPRFLSIFEQLCQALAYAHSRGVLHRDLKPANIMVGPFGEVQVMDWGLAKLFLPVIMIPSGSSDDVNSMTSDRPAGDTAVIASATPIIPQASKGGVGMTRPGTMVGTPIYIPPEQARGELEDGDARSDIFGLGGILCFILTGKAPFEAPSVRDAVDKAVRGDTAETLNRLDHCEADQEIIGLAKSCLESNKDDRPSSAADIAETIQRHRAHVQQRLHEAEVLRAQAEVRANEEVKRRRLTMISAAALILLLVGGAAGSLWYRHVEQVRTESHQRRVQDIENAIEQASNGHDSLLATLSDNDGALRLMAAPAEWRAQIDLAHSNLQRAKDLQAGAEFEVHAKLLKQIDSTDEKLKQDEKDLDTARGLDRIRLESATWIENRFNDAAVDGYGDLFLSQLNLRIEDGDPAELALRIGESSIRGHILAALDDWAAVAHRTNNLTLRDHLSKIASLADQDDLRNQIRDPASWNMETMATIHKELTADEQSLKSMLPQTYALIGSRLSPSGGKRTQWFQLAQSQYPNDFWINFDLGNAMLTSHPAEAAGYFRAALAIREDNSAAWTNLGRAMIDQERFQSAIDVLTRATEFDPSNVIAWGNLAMSQNELKDPTAEKTIRHAIGINPNYAPAWLNLGVILMGRSDLPSAVEALEKAIELDGSIARSWTNLGAARSGLMELNRAIESYEMALQLDPNLADTWYNLGNARRRVKDMAGARDAYVRATELDPDAPAGWYNLGVLLSSLQDYDAAVVALMRTVEIAPQSANAWSTLGNTLRIQKKYGQARNALIRALEHTPGHSVARVNLAMNHMDQGEFRVAHEMFGQGLKSLPPLDSRRSRVLQWQSQCKRLVDLGEQLPRVLNGEEASTELLIELADLCYRYKQRHHHAVKLYEQAFVLEPKLVTSTVAYELYGYQAAVVSVLAADPNTVDGSLVLDQERARLRKRALEWITQNMQSCAELAKTSSLDRTRIRDELSSWLTDQDLISIRDEVLLKSLAPGERAEWKEFWSKLKKQISALSELG